MKNYDEKSTEEIVNAYTAALDKKAVIAELASKFARSEKSIIGKLAREGVYQKQVYLTKRGEIPETKKEIIAHIASALSIDPERIQGLEKAPKGELQFLLLSLSQRATG